MSISKMSDKQFFTFVFIFAIILSLTLNIIANPVFAFEINNAEEVNKSNQIESALEPLEQPPVISFRATVGVGVVFNFEYEDAIHENENALVIIEETQKDN